MQISADFKFGNEITEPCSSASVRYLVYGTTPEPRSGNVQATVAKCSDADTTVTVAFIAKF